MLKLVELEGKVHQLALRILEALYRRCLEDRELERVNYIPEDKKQKNTERHMVRIGGKAASL